MVKKFLLSAVIFLGCITSSLEATPFFSDVSFRNLDSQTIRETDAQGNGGGRMLFKEIVYPNCTPKNKSCSDATACFIFAGQNTNQGKGVTLKNGCLFNSVKIVYRVYSSTFNKADSGIFALFRNGTLIEGTQSIADKKISSKSPLQVQMINAIVINDLSSADIITLQNITKSPVDVNKVFLRFNLH